MKTWWTADTHFQHENILRLGNGRPFSTIDEHDEEIVRRWNEKVGDDDTAFILGDLALGHLDEALALAKRMRGRKYLVAGNHDQVFAGRHAQTKAKLAAAVARYKEEGGFVGVNTWAHFAKSGIATPHVLQGEGGRVTVATSHFPSSASPHDEKHEPWRVKLRAGQWLLHGHIHNAWRQHGREINVGVDVWGFAPVSSEQLLKLIAQGSGEVDVRPDVAEFWAARQ